jgi:hydroxyethylthiazole kinase-like uncharacterized protein yjeF
MGEPLDILSSDQMRAADLAAIASGASAFSLMQAAGLGAAELIGERLEGRRVVVLCGPGNNGGDGYVVAAALKASGAAVEVAALAPPATGEAAEAAALWDGLVGTLGPLAASVDGAALHVDALFGIGLARPLEGDAARLAAASRSAPHAFVSLDTPSGWDADRATPVGPFGFHASLTTAFHRLKPVHVLVPGADACGEVRVVDIGIGAQPAARPAARRNDPRLWLDRYPWPSRTTHKHGRGRLGVVGGDATHTGAGRLASRAGLRVGAGLVRLYCPPDAAAANAAHLEAVMLQPFDSPAELEAFNQSSDAVVIGPACGVTDDTLAGVLALERTGAALVLDADALTVFQDAPEELFALMDRDDVLTPHAGEFERLFPRLLGVALNKIEAVRLAASKTGCVVLLKGPDTVIAAPDGRAVVNGHATPWLATAGSGDVLAGLVGGLIAQHMDSFDAACAAAWIHGDTALRFGPGLTAEDLPDLVPETLRALAESATSVDLSGRVGI